MRGVFWFLGLAAAAVTLALLVGDNQAVLTLFWPPYRIDLSFNLVLFGLLLLFVLLYGGLRGVALLRSLPEQAQRWRTYQLERTVLGSVLDALAYQLAGRFVRAQSAARHALGQLKSLEGQSFVRQDQVHVLAHLLAAESAQSLGNTAQRDEWLQEALHSDHARHADDAREGALLRAAGWAIDGQDAESATAWLAELPQGAARRIQTQRLRLRLARLTGDTETAIEVVRLLKKYRAFSEEVAQTLLRGLILDALRKVHDSGQLKRLWRGLSATERAVPELALTAMDRWHEVRISALQADATPDADDRRLVQDCLQTVWNRYGDLGAALQTRFILRLEAALPDLDGDWLAQVEQAQKKNPGDAGLQYLAGQAFMQRQLWGKAAVLLKQASAHLGDAELVRRVWRSLALLAELRGDLPAAQEAWKKAALA